MVKWYCHQIIIGRIKFTKVPSLWSKNVKTQLEKDGYVIKEDGTVEKA